MASYNINGVSYSDTTNIAATLVQSANYYANSSSTTASGTISSLRSKLGTGTALYVKGYTASYTNPYPIYTTAVVGRVRAEAFPSALKVAFNPNGGSGSASNTTYNSGQYTDKTSVGTLKGAIFNRTGYTMDGWATSASGAKSFNLSQSVQATWVITQQAYAQSLKTLNLYAHWVANTYTVDFYPNGGVGSMVQQTATYNSNFLTNPCGFTRAGYKFIGYAETPNGDPVTDGWSLNSAGVYESGKGAWKWTYTRNVKLYAIWERVGGNSYVKENGVYKQGSVYVKDNGNYVSGELYIKDNGHYLK